MRSKQMITYTSLLFRNMLVVQRLEFSTYTVGSEHRVPNESIGTDVEYQWMQRYSF